jgi:WD40 repeat protein
MLWDLESGAVRSLFARVSGQFSFTGSVVRFSHDTRFLAIRVSGSAAVHVYDTVFDRMIEAFEVTSAESDVTSFDVSSKSESMALGRRDGSVVIKTLGGSVHTVISTGSEILQVALSSDGRYLVSRDGTNVRIHRVDVATTPILVAKVPQPDAPRDATRSDLDVSFDFTGRFVQIAQIHGWDLYDLKEERLAASLRPPADAPVLPLVDVDSSLIMLSERVLRSRGVPFTIDTERLRVFSGYSDGSVQSLSLMDGTVQWKVALGSTRPDVLAITPDGGSLAVGCDDATIRILATGSGEEQFLLEDHEMPVVGLAFSPDGRNLVSIGQEQRAIRIWDVVERAPVASLDAHPVSDASFVRFAPDGRAIVWSNSRGDEAAIRWSPLGASADNAGSFLRDYALRMEGAVIQPLYAPPRKRPVPVPSP